MFRIGTVLDSSVTGCDCNKKEAEEAYYFSSGDVIFLGALRRQALALYRASIIIIPPKRATLRSIILFRTCISAHKPQVSLPGYFTLQQSSYLPHSSEFFFTRLNPLNQCVLPTFLSTCMVFSA